MPLSPAALKLQSRFQNPFLMWFGMLYTLPAAWFCGVGIRRLDERGCETTVPYGWRSQNPFRSTYFAAQAMAAEMSTGALLLLAVEDAGVPISTLIVELRSTFGKKATALTTFRCENGAEVFRAIADAKATGEARTVTCETVGTMADGTEVSRFVLTWSVKVRSQGQAAPAAAARTA